jgi:parvulin-like peptidyl-prolyl isomerase
MFHLYRWLRPLSVSVVLTAATAIAAQQTPSQPPTPQPAPAPTQQPPPASTPQQPPAVTPSPQTTPRPQTPQEREEEAERQAAQSQPRNPAPNLAAVPPTAVVITLNNVCPAAAKPAPGVKKAACVTKITRAEFDKLIEALNPDVPPQGRQNVAQGYARLLVMALAAQNRGVERDPKVATLLRLARLQALAQEFNKRLQKDAGNVTAEQIQKFYDEHQQRFLEAKLERIFVPKLSGEKTLDATKQKALAEKLRAAAATGGDFPTLQKQAYAESELKQVAPPSDLGVRRSGTLAPPQNEIVFAMKAGEISQPLEDQSGFYIYKVDSRNVLALKNAEQEIRQQVARDNYQKELQGIFEPVTPKLNPQYFGDAKMSWNLGGRPSGEEEEEERRPPPRPAPPPSSVPPRPQSQPQPPK